jgi:hypothetical protein
MDSLRNADPACMTQRSDAAVASAPADASEPGTAVPTAALMKRPRSAADRPRSHKRKGRIDRRVQAFRIRAAREADVIEHLGGRDNVSVIQEALARRWATLDLRCAQMESDASSGRAFDLTAFIYAVDRLHAISKTLGLHKVARRVETLDDIRRQYTRPEVPPSCD